MPGYHQLHVLGLDLVDLREPGSGSATDCRAGESAGAELDASPELIAQQQVGAC